jgi:hypothetical protein
MFVGFLSHYINHHEKPPLPEGKPPLSYGFPMKKHHFFSMFLRNFCSQQVRHGIADHPNKPNPSNDWLTVFKN